MSLTQETFSVPDADHVAIQQITNSECDRPTNYIQSDSCLVHSDNSPDLLERLRPAERASYKTRHGAEGDQAHGCMADTRVQIIANLEAWAHDGTAPKVY